MTLENEELEDQEPEGDQGDQDDEEEIEDEDDSGDDADDATDASDDSDGDQEGGSGSDDDDKSSEEAPKLPTGRDLIDLLAGDTEAQTLLRDTLAQMRDESTRSAEAQAQAQEFTELREKGDYAEIGRRIVERTESQTAREQVADEVLNEVFQPVYREVLSQPEFKDLTAEDKERLAPAKYDTDAHYLRALVEFRDEKRFEAAVEAEVQKRVKTAKEAEGNREVAAKTKGRSVSASPATSGPVGGPKTSSEKLRIGLRAAFGDFDGTVPADDDEE